MFYNFDCDINDEYKKIKATDEYVAFTTLGNIGAVYNYSVTEKKDESEIILANLNTSNAWELKHSCYKDYSINLNNPNWKKELEKEMFNFIIDNKKEDNKIIF